MAWLVALLSAAATPLSAQGEAGGMPDLDRGQLHPQAQPMVIVGLEQGDNDFRHRTPGLSKGDLTPTLIDPEENYRRRLEMYEGKSFREPAAWRGGTTQVDPVESAEEEPAPDEPAREAESAPAAGETAIVMLGAAAMGSLAWIGLQKRAASKLQA